MCVALWYVWLCIAEPKSKKKGLISPEIGGDGGDTFFYFISYSVFQLDPIVYFVIASSVFTLPPANNMSLVPPTHRSLPAARKGARLPQELLLPGHRQSADRPRESPAGLVHVRSRPARALLHRLPSGREKVLPVRHATGDARRSAAEPSHRPDHVQTVAGHARAQLVAIGERPRKRHRPAGPRGRIPFHPFDHCVRHVPTGGHADRTLVRFRQVVARVQVLCAQLRAIVSGRAAAVAQHHRCGVRSPLFWRGAIEERRGDLPCAAAEHEHRESVCAARAEHAEDDEFAHQLYKAAQSGRHAAGRSAGDPGEVLLCDLEYGGARVVLVLRAREQVSAAGRGAQQQAGHGARPVRVHAQHEGFEL